MRYFRKPDTRTMSIVAADLLDEAHRLGEMAAIEAEDLATARAGRERHAQLLDRDPDIPRPR